MNFVHYDILWLLLLIPLVLLYYFFKYGKESAYIKMPTIQIIQKGYKGWRSYLVSVPVIFRCLSFVFIIIALARPQSVSSSDKDYVEGIDIVLTIDTSNSMRAMDLTPDRITEAKRVADNFIRMRPNDNIAFVAFASESYTVCPLTTDHNLLRSRLKEVNVGFLNDGTFIGDALATSVARLNDSKNKSKVIILLTDGSNNGGRLSPVNAANLAAHFGIRVYTIAVGTNNEYCPFPYDDGFYSTIVNMKVDVDEAPLKEIASITGGEFFRATDSKALELIYKKIDELEKTKIEVNKKVIYHEQFQLYLFISMLFLFLDFLLRNTLFRKNL